MLLKGSTLLPSRKPTSSSSTIAGTAQRAKRVAVSLANRAPTRSNSRVLSREEPIYVRYGSVAIRAPISPAR